MPAGPWLLCCGKRQGKRNTSREFNFSPLLAIVGSENIGSAVCENEKILPIQVVMLACCLATGNFLGAGVCVFSPGAATKRSFSSAAAPHAGWASGILLRQCSFKSESSEKAANVLFFTPKLLLHFISRYGESLLKFGL